MKDSSIAMVGVDAQGGEAPVSDVHSPEGVASDAPASGGAVLKEGALEAASHAPASVSPAENAAIFETEGAMEGAIEAMLFVTDGPVSATVLAEMLGCSLADVDASLRSIQSRRAEENSGIQLREVAGGWRLYTHPAYHELIEKYVISWDTRKLSAAAMETLAIVAYLQPVTRSGVSSVRGVNSDSSINSLVEKGLVKEVGASDAPGNPILYGTTATFLEKFGLRTIADLTPIEEFAPDDETRALIAERLSSSSDAPSVSEDALSDALAQMAGVVEKIDFAALEFDFDDE